MEGNDSNIFGRNYIGGEMLHTGISNMHMGKK